MDTKVIGQFLAQLRKERNLTQEQLGEMFGVTNKTVSRWENGNYLPPVEMLQQMSELYGLTINELLSGKVLTEGEYKQQAEETIKSVLKTSSFTIQEKTDFFKKKWKKEHLFSTVLCTIALFACWLYAAAQSLEDWAFLAVIGAFVFAVVRYNVMMAYVEDKVFDTPSNPYREEKASRQKQIAVKRMRIALMMILAVSVLITVDLGYNYFSSLVPEMNDGLTVRGIISSLIFGDSLWSRQWFFEVFACSAAFTGGIAAVNLLLACWERWKL